jgi:hypothetical protein
MAPSLSRVKTREVQNSNLPGDSKLHLYIAVVPNEVPKLAPDQFVVLSEGLLEAWSVVCDRYGVYDKEDLPFGTRVVPAPLVVSGELGSVKDFINDYSTKRIMGNL